MQILLGKNSLTIIFISEKNAPVDINDGLFCISGPHKVNETNLLANLTSILDDNGTGSMSLPPGSSRATSRLLSSFFRDSMRHGRVYQSNSKLIANKDQKQLNQPQQPQHQQLDKQEEEQQQQQRFGDLEQVPSSVDDNDNANANDDDDDNNNDDNGDDDDDDSELSTTESLTEERDSSVDALKQTYGIF